MGFWSLPPGAFSSTSLRYCEDGEMSSISGNRFGDTHLHDDTFGRSRKALVLHPVSLRLHVREWSDRQFETKPISRCPFMALSLLTPSKTPPSISLGARFQSVQAEYTVACVHTDQGNHESRLQTRSATFCDARHTRLLTCQTRLMRNVVIIRQPNSNCEQVQIFLSMKGT